jgi:hypothetical protein
LNLSFAAQAPWLLAAGLNRPPGPPPDDRFRVFARSCLRGAALDGDAEWTWGHNVRAVAARAVRAETNDSAAPRARITSDFNVSVCDRFDTSAVPRELDESDRSVQTSAESTSM